MIVARPSVRGPLHGDLPLRGPRPPSPRRRGLPGGGRGYPAAPARGEGAKVTPPPVMEAAEALGIPVSALSGSARPRTLTCWRSCGRT